MAYLLFAGADYYPDGGARDLKGKFDTIDLAIEAHDPCEFDYEGGWANVLCLDSMRIVKSFWRGTWIESDEDPMSEAQDTTEAEGDMVRPIKERR